MSRALALTLAVALAGLFATESVAWADKETGYQVKGASGSGVRTLVQLAETF